MPYVLRKARGEDLYWVVNKATGEKYSHNPIPKRRAEAQRRALYMNEKEGAGLCQSKPKATVETKRSVKSTPVPMVNNPIYLTGKPSKADRVLGRGSGKDCGCGGGSNCVTKSGGAEELTRKEEKVQSKAEQDINALIEKGVSSAEAVKKVTGAPPDKSISAKEGEPSEDLSKKPAGLKGGSYQSKYLAEMYKNAFPKNKRGGKALRKHMGEWVAGQLKSMDCGCGCKGMKKLNQLVGAAFPEYKKRQLKHGERLKQRLTGGKMIDCPAGYRNDGLTCLEECKAGETDTGLTCVENCPNGFRDDGVSCRKCPDGFLDTGASCLEKCKDGETDFGLFCKRGCSAGYRDDGTMCRKCPDGYRDDGATCFKDLRCNSGWDGCCHRGAFGECYGCVRTSCDGPHATAQDAHPNTYTKGSTGQMVIWRAVRGKDIKGRVDVQGTMEEINAGIQEAFKADGVLAKLFDPEKNGVGEAFRKFGKDTEAAFASVGDELLKAFDPEKNGVGKAFRDFGDEMNRTLGNADWWKETMTNPDTYIMLLGFIASAAATILSLGTLGPAAFVALSVVGPAMKMIGDAAQGRPIDGLDIAGLLMSLVPIPGASAGAKAASEAIIKGAALGATAAKALPYIQKAVQVGKLVAEGVSVAQGFGLVPSTCLANCPPPLPPAEDEMPSGGPCQDACDRIELGYDDVVLPDGCDCGEAGEAANLEADLEDLGDGGSIDFDLDLDLEEGFGQAVIHELDEDELMEAAEDVGIDEEELAEFGLEEKVDEDDFKDFEDLEEGEELTPDEEEDMKLDFGEELMPDEEEKLDLEEPLGEEPETMMEGDVMGETRPVNELPRETPCSLKFFRIYGVSPEDFLALDHELMEMIAESKNKTHEQAMDAANKALERSGSRRKKKCFYNSKWRHSVQ